MFKLIMYVIIADLFYNIIIYVTAASVVRINYMATNTEVKHLTLYYCGLINKMCNTIRNKICFLQVSFFL